jgi:hypothetical protein
MENRKNDLLDEIGQLYEQYCKEVPGRRRPWPESLKSRVLELRGLGLNGRRIAERTKLPYHTVARWVRESKSSSFKLMKVAAPDTTVAPRATGVSTVTQRARSRKVATVTDATSEPSATVTMTLPSGVRIEGVSLEFLLSLLPKLGVVQ